jgi:hypothetical protein
LLRVENAARGFARIGKQIGQEQNFHGRWRSCS